MPRSRTALVLTPSLGGDFFGDLMSGLAREIVGFGGRLIIVETRQEHSPRDEAGYPSDFSTPVGWSHADGAIAISTGAGPAYLERLRDAGKAVVLVSTTQMQSFDAPVARPDNHQGTMSAVEHLLAHGHRRIGFVGNLTQRDIAERHAAYVQALRDSGITPDDSLLFSVPENGEKGGVAAAEAFLAHPDRPTALMIGTDRNAQGFLRAVNDAGIDVPGDVALIAFDNAASGTVTSPALSSVDPRFDQIGALASRLLWQKLRGDEVPHRTVSPRTAVLVTRESCGCRPDDGDTEADTLNAAVPPALVREQLRDVLERELLTGDALADAPVHDKVETAVSEALRLMGLGEEASAAEIQGFVSSLKRLTSRPDTLRRLLDAMGEHSHRHGIATVAPSSNTALPARLVSALWRAQASAFLTRAEAMEASIAEQYVIDAGLLSTEGTDPRDLAWLRGTRVRAGVLGMWDGDPAEGLLTIAGEYSTADSTMHLVDGTLEVADFPPAALVDLADPGRREACVVVPVRNNDRDWGLLAVVVEIDPTAVQDTHQHWAALLCAALESQRRQEEVRRSALFDTLTGLPNRQLFLQQVDHAIASRKRSGTPFSVLFLDLDGFKMINDSLGHHVGDEVLKRAAEDIAKPLRESDTAARFGGDEFVILLSDTEPGEAMVVAKRVRKALERPRTIEGHDITTKASIGIASSAVRYERADQVLHDADVAMYRAKSSEPGTIAYFDVPMHVDAVRRADMTRDVSVGLSNGEFEVLYQPIVTLETGHIDSFEAAVRWHHPTLGTMADKDFFADIEETRVMAELGDWVLAEASRQVAAWKSGGVRLHVKVPDKEFWSPRFASRTRAAIVQQGLDPSSITMEVPESVLAHHPRVAMRIMTTLHEDGIRFLIDDFGKGHSSFETPHRYPADALKIDLRYLRSLTPGRDGDDLVSSLVTFGAALGTSIEVDGVDNAEELPVLRALGCRTARGPELMPPVPAAKAASLIGLPVPIDGRA